MHSFITRLALMAITLVSVVSAASPVVAQYWAAYGGQAVSDVDWSPNDIAYYFVLTTTSTGFELPEGQSVSEMQDFVKYTKSKGAKPVFSVGGWSGSLYFSKLVETDAKRQAFAKDLYDFMVKYGFVGIDLDWEFPNGVGIGKLFILSRTSQKDDKADFSLCLQAVTLFLPTILPTLYSS
jgi:chitinase